MSSYLHICTVVCTPTCRCLLTHTFTITIKKSLKKRFVFAQRPKKWSNDVHTCRVSRQVINATRPGQRAPELLGSRSCKAEAV